MRNFEKLVDEVNGSMSVEGMPITQTDKDRIKRCAGNDKIVEEAIVELKKSILLSEVVAMNKKYDYSYE